MSAAAIIFAIFSSAFNPQISLIKSTPARIPAAATLLLEESKEIIEYSKYDYNSNGNSTFVVQEHKFPISEHIEIIEGSNVNASYSNTNKVLVSSLYVQNYYESTGTVLKPGDTFDYTFNYSIRNENNYYTGTSKNLNLEIIGIYKLAEVEKRMYESNLVSDSHDLIVDASYLMGNLPNLYYTQATYYYNVSQTNFNSKELTDKLDSFVNALNDVLPSEDSKRGSVNCMALEDLSMSKIISLVIVALAAFLCLVLILLSIGSLANTIMISVDKNKKFIGLLKALGLNEKDLKSGGY